MCEQVYWRAANRKVLRHTCHSRTTERIELWILLLLPTSRCSPTHTDGKSITRLMQLICGVALYIVMAGRDEVVWRWRRIHCKLSLQHRMSMRKRKVKAATAMQCKRGLTTNWLDLANITVSPSQVRLAIWLDKWFHPFDHLADLSIPLM